MSSETGAGISEEVKANARALSRRGVEFLDFVENHPEYLKRSTFPSLERIEDEIGYPVQAWPTFVRGDWVRDIGQRNVDLCQLVKRVPLAVFGSDPDRIGEFYGMEGEHARIVTATLANPKWVQPAIARSDFIDTGEVFQCLELNVAGSLGGWHSPTWTPDYLRDPTVRRFLDGAGIETTTPCVIRNLLSHMLRESLRAYRSAEVNIACMVTPHPDIDAMIYWVTRKYDELLASVGSVQGKIVRCAPEDLYERDGHLHVGDDRIHAVLDAASASASMDTHRCWLRGSVLMFNGPLTPVWSDKRNLALLSELADSALWTAEERELIRTTVPWTRRISAAPVHPDSAPPVTAEAIKRDREGLVLKPSSGHGGQDVFMGSVTAAEEWDEVVDRAFTEGNWLVQERLESPPHVYQFGDEGYVPCDMVWGFFVFGQTFGGSFVRMAPKNIGGPVNASRGSHCGWVLEVEDETAAT